MLEEVLVALLRHILVLHLKQERDLVISDVVVFDPFGFELRQFVHHLEPKLTFTRGLALLQKDMQLELVRSLFLTYHVLVELHVVPEPIIDLLFHVVILTLASISILMPPLLPMVISIIGSLFFSRLRLLDLFNIYRFFLLDNRLLLLFLFHFFSALSWRLLFLITPLVLLTATTVSTASVSSITSSASASFSSSIIVVCLLSIASLLSFTALSLISARTVAVQPLLRILLFTTLRRLLLVYWSRMMLIKFLGVLVEPKDVFSLI